MAVQEVVVPDIGGAEDAEVIKLLVAVGDEVAVDQSLIVLESDKASMEIPSTLAGTIVELLVAEGDQLAEGAAVIRVEVSAQADASAEELPADVPSPEVSEIPPASVPEEASSTTPASPDIQAAPAPAPPADTPPPPDNGGSVYAGPAVRKLAREFGIQLGQVTGTGPQGRVLKEDLHQFVQQSLGEGPN